MFLFEVNQKQEKNVYILNLHIYDYVYIEIMLLSSCF